MNWWCAIAVFESRSSMGVSRTAKLLNALPLLWSGLAAIVIGWLFRDHGYDDPYITYRYAVNLAHGAGFLYNASERVLSTTTPLYTLVLAGVGLIGLDIPLTSNAIGCFSLAVGGLAIWQLGQEWQAPLVGVAGLLLYPTFPLLISTLGAETTLYLALILCGFLACAREQLGRAAVLLALATLTRADGALAALVSGLFVVLVLRRWPWRVLALYCAVLVPWFVFAQLYFGALLPATLAAKQQQGQMLVSRGFLDGLALQAQNYWDIPLFRLHFALVAVGLLAVLAGQRRWLLLLGWNLLYLLGYTVLGVSGYFWYYAPLAIGFVVLVGLGVTAVHQFVERHGGARWAAAVVVALLLVVCAAQLSTLIALRRMPDSRLAIYRTIGEWLHDHTLVDDSVGTLEVGIIGYYAQRRMIDFAGLIQPETAQHLTATATYQDAALWAIQHFRPDYLVLQERSFPVIETDADVMASCHNVETFTSPGYSYRLAIYQCGW
jgi:hypothetical protein